MTWQDKVLADVHAMAEKTQSSGPSKPWIGMLLRLPPELRYALGRVTVARKVSMSTYVRRLIAMSMAKEEGKPLDHYLRQMPAAMEARNIHLITLDKSFKDKHDDGVGMEGMCTHPGCDEVHR